MEMAGTEFAKLKEGMNVELKEAATKIPDSFYETYSSFSNTSGGTIYLGVKEGSFNVVTGVANAPQLRKSLISALHSNDKVSYCTIADGDIEILDVEGKKVIKVYVPEAPKEVKPVYIKGNLSLSYERVGDGDFLLKEEAIASLLFQRRQIRFDCIPNTLGFDMSRVDLESLKAYRTYLNEISPQNIFKNFDDHDFLIRIGALRKNGNGREALTNGAVLFFGYITDILELVPGYFLDYQENLSGSTRWDYRLASDDLSFNCNVYNFFSLVSKRLIEGLPNPFKTDGVSNLNGTDLKRSVVEALVNAISNQDFLSSLALTVKKSQNGITVINSGDVPMGIEQAKKGGISEPRNANIMNYFRIIQVADRAGTGVPTIFDVFASYRFPAPEFVVERNPLRTRLSLSFLVLPINTPYHKEKLAVLAALENHPEGFGLSDLSSLTGKGITVVRQIMNELLSLGLVYTNGKKTKGRLFFKAKN